MAQHFLLSPLARSLKDDEFNTLINGNEPLAYALFTLFRWGSLTEQVCPRCGSVRAHIPRPEHKQWRCRDCCHDFSLKSGSLFDNSKLPYWKIIKGLYLFVTNAKGRSAIDISHKLNVGYQAAYVLLHKLRWTMWHDKPKEQLTGEFDVDVVWVLKGMRDANDRSPEAKAARQTKHREVHAKRLVREGIEEARAVKLANKAFPLTSTPRRSNPKKQCILAISQRNPDGKGAKYHIGVPLPTESYELVSQVLRKYVAVGSVIYSDSASAMVALAAHYEVRRVNHDTHYKSPEGHHTNYVESLFSRWRRMEMGTYHRMNPRTLHLYFADCTWRENNCKSGPLQKVRDVLRLVSGVGVCRDFRNYGRRNRMTRVEIPAVVKKAAPRVLQAIETADRNCFERLMGVLKLAAWYPSPSSSRPLSAGGDSKAAAAESLFAGTASLA